MVGSMSEIFSLMATIFLLVIVVGIPTILGFIILGIVLQILRIVVDYMDELIEDIGYRIDEWREKRKKG